MDKNSGSVFFFFNDNHILFATLDNIAYILKYLMTIPFFFYFSQRACSLCRCSGAAGIRGSCDVSVSLQEKIRFKVHM